MPGITLAELVAKLSVEGQVEVKTALDQMQVSTEKTAQKFERLTETVNRIGLAISAFIGKAIYDFKNVSESIYKFSKITELSAEASQELIYAAGQEEVSVEALQLGIKNLTKAMSTGTDETGQTIKAFGALGIKIKDDVTGKFRSATDVMLDVMDGLKGVGDTTQRNIYINELFGRGATSLAAFLGLTSDEVKQLMERAKELGIVLDTETIKSGKEFSDLMRDTQLVIKNLGITFVVELLPKLKQMNELLINAVKTFKDLPESIKDVVIALGATVAVIGTFNTALKVLLPTLGAAGLLGILQKIPAEFWLLIGVVYTAYKAGHTAAEQWNKLTGIYQDSIVPIKQITNELDLQRKAHISLNLLMQTGKITAEEYKTAIKHTDTMMALYNKHVDECNNLYAEHIKKSKEATTQKDTEILTLDKLITKIKNEIESINLLNAANTIAKQLGFSLNYLNNQSIETKRKFIILLDDEIRKTKELIEKKKTGYEDLDKKFPEWTQNEEDFLNHMRKTIILMTDDISEVPTKLDIVGEALKKLKTEYIDKIYQALGEGIKQLGAVFVNIFSSMFNKKLYDDINKIKLAMDALKRAGKENTQEYIQLNEQLNQLSKQTPGGFLKDWFVELTKHVVTLVAELLILAGVIKLLEALGVPAGALVKILGYGFDNPANDMWARKQGRDFGYNFQQGMESKIGTPRQEVQPIRIEIHNANPETYVRIFKSLSPSQKQIFYETSVLPGQRRFDQR